MIRLTPLRETASFQEALQEEHVDIVKRLIHRKFSLSPELFEALTKDLQKLELPMLKALVDQVFDIHTVEHLEQWISERLPRQNKKETP